VRLILSSLLVLALAGLSTAAMAETHTTPGFQIQVDGLAFGPVGTLTSQAKAPMTDLFGSGGGFALTATLGITPHWCVGVRAASYRSTKSGQFAFDDLGIPVGSAHPAGAGPFDIERELKLLPVQAIVQYRRDLSARVNWSADAGVGVMSSIDHMTLASSTSGELVSISGYQKDPAWTLGASLGYRIPGNFDLVGSARFSGLLTSDGAIWMTDDDPGFTNWTLGLRYPHDTH
jgi:hypothetical protein